MSCYAKVKYSEISHSETWANTAKDALLFLLKNGYIKIGAYFEIEVTKLIRCLKILGIEHKINFITPINNNCSGDYEFMLDFFEDDREKEPI